MSKLQDKVVLITGSSKGIGADMARQFGVAGAQVVVNYASSAQGAEEVVASIKSRGGKAIAVKADVSIEAEVTQLFDAAIGEYGRVDVLVNNAGVMQTKLLKDNSEVDFDRHFDINVKGTFFALKEAAAKLADNGIIINFSSSTVKLMLPSYAVYSASKAAVDQLTRVFSKEIGRGISVNAVAPGPTGTDLFLNGKTDEVIAKLASMNAFNRLGSPEDITKVVLFLASDDAKWISGQVIPINGAMV